MALATTTTAGEIVLSGDLAGGTDANFPELRASGVTPGTFNVVSRLAVDSKGRSLSISAITTSDVPAALFNVATTSSKGLVQLPAVANSLTVTNGVLSIVPASTTILGLSSWSLPFAIAVDGSLSVALPDATTVVKGIVSVPSDGPFYVEDGKLSIRAATTLDTGIATIDTNTLGINTAGGSTTIYLGANNGSNAIVPASATLFGAARAGTNVVLAGDGTLSVTLPTATTAAKGIVQVSTTSGLEIVNGVLSYNGGAAATTTSTGSVRIGNGLSVDGAGVIAIPSATTTTKGIASVASSGHVGVFSVTIGGGYLDVSVFTGASASTFGVVQIGSGFAITPQGVLSLAQLQDTASTTNKGQMQVGSGLTASAGVLSMKYATQTSIGGVRVNASSAGLELNSGVIAVVKASASVKGFVQPGDTMIMTGDVLSINQVMLNQVNALSYANVSKVASDTTAFDTTTNYTFDMGKSYHVFRNAQSGSYVLQLVYDAYTDFKNSFNIIEITKNAPSTTYAISAYFSSKPEGDVGNPKVKFGPGITVVQSIGTDGRTNYRFTAPVIGVADTMLLRVETISLGLNDNYCLVSINEIY